MVAPRKPDPNKDPVAIGFRKRLGELIGKQRPFSWAVKAGIPKPTFRKYWVDGVIPKTEYLLKIAEFTGCTVDWLLTGEGPKMKNQLFPVIAPELHVVDTKAAISSRALENYVPIPLLNDAAAAGPPKEINEADIEGFAIIYHSWCRNPEDFTAIWVNGDSMHPTLPEGCIVAVNHTKRDPKELRNKIVAFRYEGGVTIKRLFYDKKKGIVIGRPDNPASTEIVTLLKEEIDTGIIGKVEWWWGREE
jgi:phage repressor protein C with HTH and peptisase S24 domain